MCATTGLEGYGEQIARLLERLPEHLAITDTLDYALGAVYGLIRAKELGFRDRSTSVDSMYRAHLINYGKNLPASKTPHESWVGGFYFNSGIQRLAACYDRITLLIGAPKKLSAKERMQLVSSSVTPNWTAIYEEVNAFKHDVKGRAEGRLVGMAEASVACAEMLRVLKESESAIEKRYT